MNVKIIVVCACMLIPFRIFAQYNSDTTSYSKKEQGALETKKTGATITILGALALAAGMTLFNNDVDAGFAVGIGGLVATTIGLPIWIVGSVKHKKYTQKAQSLTVRLKATPHQSGLALTYRF